MTILPGSGWSPAPASPDWLGGSGWRWCLFCCEAGTASLFWSAAPAPQSSSKR